MRKILETADLALVGIGLVLIYALSPFAIHGDGAVRFDALSQLLARGDVSTTPYSLVGPLISAPLWLVGHLHGTSDWWSARFNFILFIGALGAFYRVFVPDLGRRATLRFLLLLTTASMFPHHLGSYYGEAFTALFVGMGLAFVAARGAVRGWSLAVLGVANTPASLVGFGLAASGWASYRRHAKYLVPVAVAGALVMGEAWLRRGGPFVTGYESNAGARTVLPYSGLPGFSYPFILGVLSIFFSFGKGLLFFAPGLLFAPALLRQPSSAARTTLALWLLFLAGLVLVYARWWAWYGGVFWGPRFFLFASLPAALALVMWLRLPVRSWTAEAAALIVIVWSFWVGVNGAVYGLSGTEVEICTANQYALEFLCWYVPEFSPLLRPLLVPRALSAIEYTALAYAAVACLYVIGARVLDAWPMRQDAASQELT